MKYVLALFMPSLFIVTLSCAQDIQLLKNGKSNNVDKNKIESQNPIISKLKTYFDKSRTEKIYLQFDKRYYAAGDTIYFKGYLTTNLRHKLSTESGVLHVDWINTQNKIEKSLLLKIIGGITSGDFTLPDSLQEGEYRVRAYTNLMVMQDNRNILYYNILIGSAKKKNVPEDGRGADRLEIAKLKPDIQFFPEGGTFVEGLKCKIAFKAIAQNGLGVSVKGRVVDKTGKIVCQFESSHLGMGYFYITPGEQMAYKAELTYADGTQDSIPLPVPASEGINLSVNNDSLPKVSLTIATSKLYYQQHMDAKYLLLLYSGGIATKIEFKLDSDVTTFDIAKRHLFTGVNTITLFSNTEEPLCERLFFVQNFDQLSLLIHTDQKKYSPRQKVTIALNAKNRADSSVVGNFSVAVVDENIVPVDENSETTILSDLLLTSDIKGTVEKPNYYFNETSEKKLKKLDLVMLTHGYRCFEWSNVLNDNKILLRANPEKNLEIDGQALTLTGKPLKNGVVALLSPTAGLVLSQQTDSNGEFKFSNLDFSDTTHFILQAANANGGNKTKLVYKTAAIPEITPFVSETNVNQKLSTYLTNSTNDLNQNSSRGNITGIMLKQVNVREVKRKDNYRSSVLGGPGHATQVIHMDQIMTGGLLSDKLNGIARGITFLNYGGRMIVNPTVGFNADSKAVPKNGATIIVDGSQMDDYFDINSLANDVETVEILKGAEASIYGMNGSLVIAFTTKIGTVMNIKDIPSVGVLPIIANGYYKAKKFYSPQYDIPNKLVNNKDLRSTIYWNPALVTDKDGKAAFSFYNADGIGKYRIIIEGIDSNGNLGRKVYRYEVN